MAVRNRVRAGMYLLNERVSDWLTRIDEDPDVDLLDPHKHILARVFGTVGKGRFAVNNMSDVRLAKLGFAPHAQEGTEDYARESTLLSAEWNRFIQEQRAQVSQS